MSRDTLFASAAAGDSDYRLNIDDDGTQIDAAFAGDDDIEFHELIANADGIDDICTLLHSESMTGNAERVRNIVRAYADKNILVKLGSNKETALHLAADCGNTEVVEVLIDAARSLPSSSVSDDPDNQITCFEDFIRHPNDCMNTALHLAVSNGHMAIAKQLIEADPNDKHIQNSKGETPIYLAAKLGYEEMVQMMCEVCTAPSLAGPDGTTALHAAIMMLTEGKNEGLAVVTALINAAKTSASSANRSRSSVRSFLRQSNKTALHLAVRRNHLDVVELILRADPSLLIKNDRNDFKPAIYKAAEQGYRDMVILLCKRYDEVQNNLVCKGLTGLCAAIIGRDKESVDGILRSAKHLVTNVDHRGWTPLHYAAYYEFDSVLELIVKAQVSVRSSEAVYKAVPTPLFLAAQKGHTSTVMGLMKLLPDSCIVTNNQGQNILHLAAAQNNKEMVQRILLNCPKKYTKTILNGKDINGNTPIHLLICHGCFIPGLLHNNKWPVDMTIRNKWEWTPGDMLYFEEDIIGDQLQIKIKFDHMQTLPWKFWRSPSTRESSVPLRSMGSPSISESSVPSSKRSRKDAKFEMAEKKLNKEEGERSRQIVNTQIVVTALITTITFTAGFTMPGGLHQSGEPDQGLTILSKKAAFQVFMVSDALALVLSSTVLFLYFMQLFHEKPTMQVTAAAAGINMGSVIAMLLTFVSGTNVVLSNSPALAITVALISSFFFMLVLVMLTKMISDRKIKEQKSSVSLSRYF